MRKIVVILVFTLLNRAAFYYGVLRINYDLLMPGGIKEVVDKVEIDTDNEQTGSFNTVFVYSVDRPTRIMDYMSEFFLGADSREMSVATSKLSNDELQLRGQILYDTGIEYSLIFAYNEAGADMSYAFDNVSVVYYDKDLNDIDMGIQIIGIDGIEFDDYEGFFTLIENKDEVTLNTNEGDYDISRTDGYFGFSVAPDYEIVSAEPAYEIKRTNTSGSSGGLLQTLSIFNMLTEFDYTYGLTVAGTGTISVNGYVGPIGGVEQKVITADREDVDVFFIPSANYEEAMEVKNELNLDVNIVEVQYFEDAVDYLKEFGS